MQFKDRINAIEARAQAIGLTLHKLCDLAGVEYSTIHRWRTGATSPNVSTLNDHLGTLEDELSKQERKLRRLLSKPVMKAARAAL